VCFLSWLMSANCLAMLECLDDLHGVPQYLRTKVGLRESTSPSPWLVASTTDTGAPGKFRAFCNPFRRLALAIRSRSVPTTLDV